MSRGQLTTEGVRVPVEVDSVLEAGTVVHLQGFTLTLALVSDTLLHVRQTRLGGWGSENGRKGGCSELG